MLQFFDQRRIMDLQQLRMALVIGRRHEQIEGLARRKQGSLRILTHSHRSDRVVHQAGHDAAAERRFEPARAHEQRQVLPHFSILDRWNPSHRRGSPDQRKEKPFAPFARPRLGRQEDVDVGVLDPEVAQHVHPEVMAQGPRQHGAIDAPRRCSSDDVDDHPQLNGTADLFQQIEVDFFRIVFRVAWVLGIKERCQRPLRAVPDTVQCGRRTHQLEYFLADPMHIDGERNAAETNQCNA
jgi:hypothetical protein